MISAHERSIALGIYGYRDPVTGLLVFNAAYLWERGFCCETGCRHCPYVGRSGAADIVNDRRV